jgi:hypothetical protein
MTYTNYQFDWYTVACDLQALLSYNYDHYGECCDYANEPALDTKDLTAEQWVVYLEKARKTLARKFPSGQ